MIDRTDSEATYRYWDRLVIPALVILIMSPFLFYMGITVRTARDIRRSQSLERNFATAQLAARLVDQQCETALSALGVLAKRQISGPLDNADPRAIRRNLSDAVELIPDLLFAAVYLNDGTVLAQYADRGYPDMRDRDWRAISRDWFRKASVSPEPSVGAVYRLRGPGKVEVIALEVPVGRRREGSLVAYYRLRVVDAWLKPIRFGPGCALYLVGPNGKVLAASSGDSERLRPAPNYTPLHQALKQQQGMIRTTDLAGREPALVGYAPARVPGWAVLVVQPETAALASTDYLVNRVYLVAIPLLLVMIAAGGVLDYLHRRQAHLARRLTVVSRDLARQNDLLLAADQAKSEFLANVSHDLRTPLANIQASVTGMMEPGIHWDQSNLSASLSLVHEEIDRLTGRVRNLLEMSRIEAGALPMRTEPCDLADIAGSALERMEPALRGRQIEAKFPSGGLLVQVDFAQIENVIINLLENAVKYSPRGTRIYLRGETYNGEALVTVSDEGSGVGPGDEERVFQKFYRAETSSSAGGIGLGLAICKAIVDEHGGTIGVRRASCGGAEFWFSLPLMPHVWT